MRALRAVGGLLSSDDLACHQSDWVEPLSLHYRDVEVFELPPNSQGIIALMMLDILQNLSSRAIARGGETYVHLLAEAARLAYADREAFITDPCADGGFNPINSCPRSMVESARCWCATTPPPTARRVRPETPSTSARPTKQGISCPLIESNYMGIGSGIMAGETGVMLQNRGAWFSLDQSHPNVIAPRKRTMHTLMPGMAFRQGKPWLVFGTMGGSMQAQIHVQILTRLIDQGLPIDRAIDAPRFDAVSGYTAGAPSPGAREPLRRRDPGRLVCARPRRRRPRAVYLGDGSRPRHPDSRQCGSMSARPTHGPKVWRSVTDPAVPLQEYSAATRFQRLNPLRYGAQLIPSKVELFETRKCTDAIR